MIAHPDRAMQVEGTTTALCPRSSMRFDTRGEITNRENATTDATSPAMK